MAETHPHASLIAEVYSLSSAGRYGKALQRVASALAQQPHDGELQFARASVLFDWGRIREARAGFLRAEANGLSRTAVYLNLAWACHLLRLSDEAEGYARKAIELDPSVVPAHFGLGAILQRLKRYPAAMASYERALELAPDYAEAAAGVAHCRLELHQYRDAEDWMRRALALAPHQPQFWTNLGVALANQERYPEAFDALQRAGRLESARGAPRESAVDLGFALIQTGQDAAAAELYRQILADLPDPRAHGHYALASLALGHFRDGWQQYAFRWLQEPHLSHRPGFTQPVWAGQDLAGKTILLRAEQGAGDVVQFARFAVRFKELGASVLLEARPALVELARGFSGVDQAFAPPTPPPAFDYYLHLMDIPAALGTELATIPAAVPYLQVDPVKLQQWAPRIAGPGLKVGLAWAGNPAHLRDASRSMPLGALDPLWQLQGVRYFSLQKPLKPGEREAFPTRTPLYDLGPELGDFADTAAAIAQLDLVICVDTAIAHIAGALAKPVWLLLPEIGDFRWLKKRDDSPWYPTMRLFRQRRQGEWEEVVARVQAVLQGALDGGLRPGQALARGVPRQLATLDGDATRPIADTTMADPKALARVTETRHGIMQYLPDVDAAARSIAWYGEYLRPQLDLLVRLVRPGAHVVEVGSGVGEHALALAKTVGPEGHLFLYENRPTVQRILQQNLQLNRLGQCVTLMRRELAAPLEPPDEPVAITASIAESGVLPDAGYSTETLDELLLERLDLLKIRSGARALAILEGASATLWRLRPALFISAENPQSLAQVAARAQAHGYRCWRMHIPLFSPDNFNRRDKDIFAGDKALALLAIPEEAHVAVALDGCQELTEGTPTGLRTQPDRTGSLETRATGTSAESGLWRLLRKLLR